MRRRASIVIHCMVIAAALGLMCACKKMREEKPQEPFAARVTIDAGKMIRRIPRELYGTNIPWRWNGTGAWMAPSKKFNPKVVKYTKELRPSLIRFPGGTLGDYYDWRKGVGPVDSRQKMVPLPFQKDKPELPGFGTDEALEFARQVGAHLLVGVNALTGTKEMAAQWVKYINKVKASSNPDYRVTYWQIGNEVYHKPGRKKIRKGATFLTPEQYSMKFLSFSRAMKSVDPGIKIGAVGLQNYGRYRFNSFPNWNDEVLSRIGGEMDFFAQHNAYSPVGMSGSTRFYDGYRTMLGSTKLIGENLKLVARQIENHVPQRASNIPIAVTEWGPLFHIDNSNPWCDHVKTLGSAIYTASTLRAFVECPQVGIANQFKLSDFSYLGLLANKRSTPVKMNGDFPFRPTPSYFAFKFFTCRFGPNLVSTSVDVPVFSSPAGGWMAAVKGVPYLEVSSSVSDDGTHLYLIGINKSFKAPVEARINLSNFSPAKGSVHVLSGRSLASDCGTGPIQVPGINYAQPVEDPDLRGKAAGEAKVRKSQMRNLSTQFNFTFPARSVTSIVLNAATN